MRITSAGLVGIGTTAPVSALNVAGTTGLTWTFGSGVNNLGLATFGTPGTGGSLYINTPSGSATYQSGLGIDGTYGTPSLQSVINIRALGVKSGGGYGSQLAFWTTNGATLNQQMTLDMNGNLGIGTATPAQKLDVSGNLKIRGTGNGIIFPDGTVQSTAGTGSGSGGGTITGVTAGTGLTGGGTTGNVTLSLASASCAAGSAMTGLPLTCQPVATAGSYATLGSNAFVGDQTITGNLSVTANQNISGSLTLTGTVNGWTIVPNKTASCTIFGTSGTCQSANGLGGFTGLAAGSGGTGGVVRANSVTSGVGGGHSMQSPVVGANSILNGVVGGTISGGGGAINQSSYANTVTNHWGTVAGGSLNQAGDGTGPASTFCCQSVGGGDGNTASGNVATVVGGFSNTASGNEATVGGGYRNSASGSQATLGGARIT